MNTIIKSFNELTTTELYEILKSRAAVFGVEFNCAYQDMDDVDYNSLHVFVEEYGKVVAYLRIFANKTEAGTVQMGRVLTTKRGIGLGEKVVKAGIEAARTKMMAKKIYIEARTYTVDFYERFGFKVTSDEFYEVGIPHVSMELEITNM